MAFYDRDYYRGDMGGRGPRLAFGSGVGKQSIVFKLLVINIVIFVADGILGRFAGQVMLKTPDGVVGASLNPLESIGYFSVYTVSVKFQIWRLLTFQFLHSGIGHILGNMIGLFFFGPMIEQYLGSRRFLRFYLLCGFAGPLAYLILWGTGLVVSHAWAPLIGASAGVFGILIATALVAPRVNVLVMFILPIPIRVLAWIIVGIAAYTVLVHGHQDDSNAGGQAAHLGGAALGFLLIKYPQWLEFRSPVRITKLQGMTHDLRRRQAGRKTQRLQEEDAAVDRILTKVKEKGIHSLTAAEKRMLQRATDRQRRVRPGRDQ